MTEFTIQFVKCKPQSFNVNPKFCCICGFNILVWCYLTYTNFLSLHAKKEPFLFKLGTFTLMNGKEHHHHKLWQTQSKWSVGLYSAMYIVKYVFYSCKHHFVQKCCFLFILHCLFYTMHFIFFKLSKLRCYFFSVFYQLHFFKETLTKIANIPRPQYHLPQQGGVKYSKYKIEMHVRWKMKTKKKSSGWKNGLTIF